MPPHLFVDISSHGFGHLGQTAPMLAELRRRLPDMRLTLRCGLAKAVLAGRIPGDFIHIRETSDFGYMQHDAVSIDHDASRRAYQEAHTDFQARIAAEAAFLQRLRPDLVLSNVAYLPLAGAQAAGIPAVAMSSLNWLDLARHYYGREAWALPMLAEMEAAYASADLFIAPTPAMPMTGLARRRPVGPIARVAEPDARRRMRTALQIREDETLVLVAMGGFDMNMPTERWPLRAGLRYLMPEAWDCPHPAALHFSRSEQDFTELLRAADAVLTKPGYGTIAEAGCNGTPLLYLSRQDWPEEECLVSWLSRVGRCRQVSRASLDDGTWVADLEALLSQAPKPGVQPTGIAEAADLLLPYLTG